MLTSAQRMLKPTAARKGAVGLVATGDIGRRQRRGGGGSHTSTARKGDNAEWCVRLSGAWRLGPDFAPASNKLTLLARVSDVGVRVAAGAAHVVLA
jgi:hypothetical protein